ncbi:MAG: SPFH domain-containing protein [Planctomycetota bacterium]
MNEDPQTYGRATSAALLGLAAQLVFVVVVAGLGLYARSAALYAAAWYLLGGVPVWGALWLIYNQHRLERLEALEAEQLARADARAAALFDEAGHNLASARRRLEGFYRWGLNVVSATIAVHLLAAGLALFFGHLSLIDATDDGRDFRRLTEAALGNAAVNLWLVVGLCVLVAFFGFLVARYVAGMTRASQWKLLRGGAGYLIGNVLVVVLVGVGAAAAAAMGHAGVLAALSLVVPLLMAVLGVETLLALVFGVYRPRQKGEVVRPAFDSRLLGWLTQPESLGKIVSETLNYQFGFEITKSWFYVLLGRALAPLLAAGIVLMLALSCVVIVAPHQQAVVTDRGRLVRIAEPGVSFKTPWPLGRAQKFDVRRSQQIVIGGYDESRRIAGTGTLWTTDHVAGEIVYFPTAPTQIDDDAVRESIERDLVGQEDFDGEEVNEAAIRRGSPGGGVISLQAVVTYHIGDLERYIGATDAAAAADRPERLLTVAAQRRLSAEIASLQVDQLLGTERMAASRRLFDQIRADVAPYGIAVDDVLLYDIHPPKEGEVAAAFLEQVNALQAQQTVIENARRDAIATLSSAAGSRAEALRIEREIATLIDLRNRAAEGEAEADTPERIAELEERINRLIDDAGGQAAATLADARQQRWEVALAEKADTGRFDFELAAFNIAPEYFKSRVYLDALAERFGEASRRVITTVPLQSDASIRLNLEEAGSAADLFTPGQ